MRARVRLTLAMATLLVAVACGSGGAGDSFEPPPATTLAAGTAVGDAPARAVSSPTDLRLTEMWTWPAPPPSSGGMPAADADGIALTSGHQRLTMLDAAGAARWTAPRRGLRALAPALTPEVVVAATDDGVAAFDRRSGQERWVAALGERPGTPVVAGDRVLVTTFEGSLVGLELSSGRVAWRAKLGGLALGPPATAGAVAVATFDTGRVAGVVAVDTGTGRRLWSAPLPADGVSGPAIDPRSRTVVVVAADIAAHGLSLDDGRERWRRPLDGSGSPEAPPLVLGDGAVLVAHRLGGLAMLEAADGRVRWSADSDGVVVRGGPAGPGQHGWFALPLDDGRLMLAGPDRDVDIRQPSALVSGVAAGPGGLLLVGLAQGEGNGLAALKGW